MDLGQANSCSKGSNTKNKPPILLILSEEWRGLPHLYVNLNHMQVQICTCKNLLTLESTLNSYPVHVYDKENHYNVHWQMQLKS